MQSKEPHAETQPTVADKGGFPFLCRSELFTRAIPKVLNRRGNGGSLLRNEMLSLYRSVENQLPEPAQKTLQFVAAHEGAGVSSVVRAFAIAATERLGKSVLIVDAAQHNPTQHRHFDLVETRSWSDVVQSGECAEKACHQVGSTTLFLSPAPPEPRPALDAAAIASFLEELRNSFHYVLVDSSPAALTPDTLALAPHVDGVILVVEAERTRWPVALALKEQTEQAGGRVLGMVFNKRRQRIPGFLYRRL